MTSKRTRDDGRIPELGSGPARPSRADQLGASPARPSKTDQLGGTTGDAFFGSGTFDADDLGGSLDLALDDSTDVVSSGPRPAQGAHEDDVIERTAEGARSLPARPLVDDGPWPTGVSPSSATIAIDA